LQNLKSPGGSESHPLRILGLFVYRPVWSRTASALGKGLRILDLTTGQTTVLTDGSCIDDFPSWSPDGSTIAFTRNMQGNYDIFTIRPDGSGLQRLTTDPGNDAHSTWSPDGQWIAFASG